MILLRCHEPPRPLHKLTVHADSPSGLFFCCVCLVVFHRRVQTLIAGFATWVALLQPANFGLAASLCMWIHQIVTVVASSVLGLGDAYSPLNDAVYFGFLTVWSLALWLASRNRDADAVEERRCEARAAAGAERCLGLVHAMLPPAVIDDLRDRLVQQLPLTVAYSYDEAFMLQSDIVVSEL